MGGACSGVWASIVAGHGPCSSAVELHADLDRKGRAGIGPVAVSRDRRPAACWPTPRRRARCRCRRTSRPPAGARATEGRDPAEDRERYQTVYARAPGAVAAPTAGLHFTEALLERAARAGHELATLTLHVGPGTFRPVEAEDPREHHLDPEHYESRRAAAAAVNRARAEGRPDRRRRHHGGAHAGGAGRAEGAAAPPAAGSTALFILPGHRFRVVTDLVTNFHLPRSTLLMLVAAFAGRELVLDAYARRWRSRLPLLQLRRRHVHCAGRGRT